MTKQKPNITAAAIRRAADDRPARRGDEAGAPG